MNTKIDYHYIFTGIANERRRVTLINHKRNKKHNIQIRVDDKQLLSRTYHQFTSITADLVDLATAISLSDRLLHRSEYIRTNIHITLPLRHPEIFSQSQTLKYLHDALYWFSGDYWSFTFELRSIPDRHTVLQQYMPINSHPFEVALWSGGLDSLAGLCNRLTEETTGTFTLFGTGSHEQMLNTQRHVAEMINEKFEKRTKLIQVTIRSNQTKGLMKNNRPRTRGFVFLLLGAVCAYLEGHTELNIYENGIGAINLPFSESAVGWDHLRPVHPISMVRMANLVSFILGIDFTYKNRFLFKTKAQMCKVFTQKNMDDLVVATYTCTKRYHEEGLPQCGFCAACLLRKQAMIIHDIKDTNYVFPNRRKKKAPNCEHLKAMLYQIDNLRDLLNRTDAWQHLLNCYPNLLDIIGESTGIKENDLLTLYTQYVQEWDSVGEVIMKDFSIDHN